MDVMIDPKLRALIQSVIDSVDNDGCSDDLTVASKSAIEALADYKPWSTDDEYVNQGGYDCPSCHSGRITYSGDVFLNSEKCHHECTCKCCGAEWHEVYVLSGYVRKDG